MLTTGKRDSILQSYKYVVFLYLGKIFKYVEIISTFGHMEKFMLIVEIT